MVGGGIFKKADAVVRRRAGAGAARSRYLGPVRRIERLAAPAGRFVALVFEDGPTSAPARPGSGEARWKGNGQGPPGTGAAAQAGAAVGGAVRSAAGGGAPVGITESILHALKAYRAAATFAVVGSVDGDGVAAEADLTRSILADGHELANHSFRHLPFGPSAGAAAGGRPREFHESWEAALADVQKLHAHVQEQFGYEMRLGRPPGLVDGGGPGAGKDAFDLYAVLGYNYLGLDIDGGGWQASSGSFDNDVERMVLGLQRPLEKDGRALSGRVVSFRNGYDLSGRSPVVSALPRILQLFRNYGYRVVTVSTLLAMSPFADLGPDEPAFAAAKWLAEHDWWVAYHDNTVRPDSHLVRGELAVLALGAARPGDVWEARPPVYADVPAGHPYRWHVETAATNGFWRGLTGAPRPSDPAGRGSRVFGLLDPVSVAEFQEVMSRAGLAVGEVPEGLEPPPGADIPPDSLTRGQALVMIHGAVRAAEAAEREAAAAEEQEAASAKQEATSDSEPRARRRAAITAGRASARGRKEGPEA